MNMIKNVSAVCLLAVGATFLSAVQPDRLFERGRDYNVYVERETVEELIYRMSPSAPRASKKRWSDVVRVVYGGMNDGYFKAGMDAKKSGRFEEAATHFMTLAASATREWEQVYGNYYQGECWELAKAFPEAAAAFAAACAAAPEHRLWLDSKYRQGVNLARGGSTAEAQEVAKELAAYGQANLRSKSGSDARANAVIATILAVNGKLKEAERTAKRVTLRPSDGETWFHWGNFWAGFMSEKGDFKSAANMYNNMLKLFGDGDPSQKAELTLGLAIAMSNAGAKEQALLLMVSMDALPYGSPSQRTTAQYWSGRLLWETAAAEEAKNSEEQDVIDFIAARQEQARMLLDAAATSISDSPDRQNAIDFLSTLPAEESEEAAAEGAEGEADAPAEGEAAAAAPATP